MLDYRVKIGALLLFLPCFLLHDAIVKSSFADEQYNTSEFVMCYEKTGKCQTDAQPFWVNETVRRDYESRTLVSEPLDGIVITSESLKDNISLYLIGYDGLGRYELKGTPDGRLVANTNALYSDDVAQWAYWIDPSNSGGSFVEVTDDSDGLLSGSYSIQVYYEGKHSAANEPVVFSGKFTAVPRNNAIDQ